VNYEQCLDVMMAQIANPKQPRAALFSEVGRIRSLECSLVLDRLSAVPPAADLLLEPGHDLLYPRALVIQRSKCLRFEKRRTKTKGNWRGNFSDISRTVRIEGRKSSLL
jgi:hypothetical protein